MKTFSELNIKPSIQGFSGKKISIEDVVGREIIIYDFQIEPSKYQKKGDETCLHLQIESDGSKRVVFSGSKILQDMIRQVPKDAFPFKTTITFSNKRYEFT